ncbi:MAG: hypothetical protein BGN88_12760 [Clostridiales bacterium 43-6]|nr:MAG: hypothetical protein BGN88_12760 [Clostridiales bacterium 43-6]
MNVDRETDRDFIEFYQKYNRAVFYTALRMLKDFSLAEDIMQEVFIRLQKSLREEEVITYPGAWLMTVTKNLCINLIHKNAKEQVTESIDTVVAPYHENFTKVETAEYIRNVLHKLPEEEREIFELHVLGGLKHAEIAKMMAIPASSVRWKFMNARKKLKKILSGEQKGGTDK